VSVADAVRANRLDVLVASGGGVRNPVLMERLAAQLPAVRLLTADDLGIPSDAKEAIAFALVGWATLHGLPANVPSCTGAAGPCVLGSLTPAPGRPLPPTVAAASWPGSLRFGEPGR
jgi:anhydro-N-acetylmuramic acid kinase